MRSSPLGGWAVVACVVLVVVSACATPAAPAPPASPPPHVESGGWQMAEVELPTLTPSQAHPAPAATTAPPAAGATAAAQASPQSSAQVSPRSSATAVASCSSCPLQPGSHITSIVDIRQSYIAFGYVAPPARAAAWISDKGAKWRPIENFPGPEGAAVLAAVSDPGGIVAVGGDDVGAVSWRSLSGTSWASAPMPLPSDDAGAVSRATSVTRMATGYVAGGYVEKNGQRRALFWRSLNGSTWIPVEPPAATSSELVTGLVAGAGTAVAVGISGDETSGTAAVWLTANDGVTWRRVVSDSFALGRMRAAAVQGTGYVAVGEAANRRGAAVWTSADGREWQPISLPPELGATDHEIVMTAVANAGQYLVAVGWQGTPDNRTAAAWRSANGRAWQALPSAASFAGSGMTAVNADSSVVAVGERGLPNAAQVWLLPARLLQTFD